MLAKGEPLLRVICFALGSASVRIRSLVISHIFSSIISRYAIIPIVIQYYIFPGIYYTKLRKREEAGYYAARNPCTR